jgi:GalNAc-alpha-(1->4)-GalNAc-alpha-(1->3)-diNAcBac-PP-undecaprenol alpha-1,4-N-acetyl-D-galactosaminyltransferase
MAREALQSSVAPRVLMVTGALDCGGAQRVLTDMANYWATRGWQVTLATWNTQDNRDFYALASGIERLWLGADPQVPLPGGRLQAALARMLTLRRLLRCLRPDAVLSFIDVSNVFTLLAAQGLGLRVVVSERTSPGVAHAVPQPWAALRRLCYPWAAEVVAQTRDAAEWLAKKCRVRALVIPNALRPLPSLTVPREPAIVAVGRLSSDKGFDILLRSFAQISAAFPDWKLFVIGEGPERAALTALRHELRLDERVEFVGQIQGIEAWLARAGLVVHPSRREGFPNAVLEAMGMGAAVISADCHSGPRELIVDGVNGRLVPVDDVATLARVMSELMAAPELRERLGQEALKTRETFAQGLIMERWAQCLVPAFATPAPS